MIYICVLVDVPAGGGHIRNGFRKPSFFGTTGTKPRITLSPQIVGEVVEERLGSQVSRLLSVDQHILFQFWLKMMIDDENRLVWVPPRSGITRPEQAVIHIEFETSLWTGVSILLSSLLRRDLLLSKKFMFPTLSYSPLGPDF